MIAFVKKWGWLILLGLGSVLTWIFTHKSPVKVVQNEYRATQAEGEVQKLLEERGRDAAIAEVQKKYEAQKASLSHDEQEQAAILKSDPVALARWLANAGR